MAEVINSFLVGIGYDYDDSGAKEMDAGMDGIKSKSLQAGAAISAAIIAGAFGAAALANNFAEAKDELGKFSEVYGVTANDVAALGYGFELSGGSSDGILSQIESLEKIRAATLTGDYSVFEKAGIAGANAGAITGAKNSVEAYIALANQFEKMSSRQRINAAAAFGLDDSSIRLLSTGSNGVRALMDDYKKMRPISDDMTKSSAEYNDQVLELKTNIGGLADKLSMALLPNMTDTVKTMNEWVDINRELIDQNMDETLAGIADGLGLLTVAGGLLASGGLFAGLASMAKSIPIIGGGLAAIATSAVWISGIGAAAAGGAAAGTVIYNNLSNDARDLIGGTVAQMLADLGVSGAQDAIDRDMAFRSSFNMNSQPTTINLVLDGKVIDQKIIDHNERENQATIEELTSPTAG